MSESIKKLRKAKIIAKYLAGFGFESAKTGIARLLKKPLSAPGKFILIDIDGTLVDTNVSFELLKTHLGKEEANNIYKKFKNMALDRKMTTDEILVEAHKHLTKLRPPINITEYEKTLKRIIAEGKVRKDVVEAAQYAQKIGREVIFVTKSSHVFAELLAEKYLGDRTRGMGSREKFDKKGKLLGIEYIVSDKPKKMKQKEHGKTKIDLFKEWCQKKGIPFRKRDLTVLSDSILDSRTLRYARTGILLLPLSPKKEQRLAEKLKLRDYTYRQSPYHGPDVKKLKRILRKPIGIKYPRWIESGQRKKR